jgi:DNA-directed RNA polymerase specialized sigma24 family protein
LWLYGVARRVLANHHRGARRRSALTERLRADLALGYEPPEFDGGQAQIAEASFSCRPRKGNCFR